MHKEDASIIMRIPSRLRHSLQVATDDMMHLQMPHYSGVFSISSSAPVSCFFKSAIPCCISTSTTFFRNVLLRILCFQVINAKVLVLIFRPLIVLNLQEQQSHDACPAQFLHCSFLQQSAWQSCTSAHCAALRHRHQETVMKSIAAGLCLPRNDCPPSL